VRRSSGRPGWTRRAVRFVLSFWRVCFPRVWLTEEGHAPNGVDGGAEHGACVRPVTHTESWADHAAARAVARLGRRGRVSAWCRWREAARRGRRARWRGECEHAVRDSQARHASAVEALQLEAAQLKKGHSEQLERFQTEHAAARAQLMQDHAAVLATTEAELTVKLITDSAVHAETTKELEASMATAVAEHVAAITAQRKELAAVQSKAARVIENLTTSLESVRSELAQTEAAADEATCAAMEAAQAHRTAFAELEQSGMAVLAAERKAHENSKQNHAQQVSDMQAEHSTALTALIAEAASKVDAEKAAHAKSVDKAAAAVKKAVAEHALELARLNAERDSQLEAATASQFDNSQSQLEAAHHQQARMECRLRTRWRAELQDSQRKAVENLIARHEKALSDSQEQHDRAVRAHIHEFMSSWLTAFPLRFHALCLGF
jgi:hypothetical protein